MYLHCANVLKIGIVFGVIHISVQLKSPQLTKVMLAMVYMADIILDS